jgi:hypothetical protein
MEVRCVTTHLHTLLAVRDVGAPVWLTLIVRRVVIAPIRHVAACTVVVTLIERCAVVWHVLARALVLIRGSVYIAVGVCTDMVGQN